MFRFTTILAVGMIASASMAVAQTAPMPPAYNPQTPPAYNPQMPQQYAPPIQQTIIQGYSGNQDYPAAEVQAVPAARARAYQSKWVQYQAQDDVYRTVSRLREDFNFSPEYLRASADEAGAYSAYLDARQDALRDLRNDPNYRAHIEIAARLKEQLDDQRPDPKVKLTAQDLDEQNQHRLAMSMERLVHTSTASSMEAAVLASDEHVQSARTRLVEAGRKTTIMREAFERQIRRDEQFVNARRNFEDARIQRIAAGEYYAGTLDAQAYALDFAYYIHRYDQIQNQFAGYGYGGYGGGYGYGSYPVNYSVAGYNYGYRYR